MCVSLGVLLSLVSTALGQMGYDLEIIARTGTALPGTSLIIRLGTGPSVNDLGHVGFAAWDADGRAGVFVENAGIIDSRDVFASNFSFGELVQINNLDQVVWWEQSHDGLFVGIKRLGAIDVDFQFVAKNLNAFQTSPFDFPLPWTTLNNSGRVVFSAEMGLATVLCTPKEPTDQGLNALDDYHCAVPLGSFPALFPMVADNDFTVVRGGGDETAPLVVFTDATLNQATALGVIDFSVIGAMPGISDDGRLVAFMGVHATLGGGIFGLQVDVTPPVLFKIAGNAGLSSVGRNTRVGVNHAGDGSPNHFTVAYLATSAPAVPGQLGPMGLYISHVDVTRPAEPLAPFPVIQVGQPIPGLSGAVQDIRLYDPINNRGQLVFWVRTDTTIQAIVRATPKRTGPLVQLRVDANRDGRISFADDSDKTSPVKPYRFWINNDDHAAPSAADVLGLALIANRRLLARGGLDRIPPQARDASDAVIDHIRDLEDFAPLQITLNAQAARFLFEGSTLSLETTGGIQVRIFPAIQAGQDYLFDRRVAERQLQHAQERGALPQDDLLAALDLSSLSQGTDTIFYGLFEGVTTGAGMLRLVLRAPDGSEVASDAVHLQLLEASAMYQRAQGTSDGVPESDREHFRFLPPFDPDYRASPHVVGYRDDTPDFVPPPDEDKDLAIFVHGCCIDIDTSGDSEYSIELCENTGKTDRRLCPEYSPFCEHRTMDTQSETTERSFVYNRIPTKVSRKDFNRYIAPYVQRPKKGPQPKRSLYKIFNAMLYVFHTGIQWHHLMPSLQRP
jgi:hypothetical protein